ncbi:hypothetical protein [Nocardia sp. NPDC005825]
MPILGGVDVVCDGAYRSWAVAGIVVARLCGPAEAAGVQAELEDGQ